VRKWAKMDFNENFASEKRDAREAGTAVVVAEEEEEAEGEEEGDDEGGEEEITISKLFSRKRVRSLWK